MEAHKTVGSSLRNCIVMTQQCFCVDNIFFSFIVLGQLLCGFKIKWLARKTPFYTS